MIRGEVHLIFRDKTTGEITKELTKKNVITESMLHWMADPEYDSGGSGAADFNGLGKFGEYIFLSDMEHRSDRDWVYVYNPIAIGRTESGIQNPDLLNGNIGSGGTHAYYIQHQQRFDPPASTRTIRVICLGRWDQDDIPLYKAPITVGAYLPLTTPCTQSPTETLDVFYRIIFDNPDRDTDITTLSNNQIYRVARRHIYSGSGYTNDYIYYPQRNYFFHHGKKITPYIRDEYVWQGHRGNSSKIQDWVDGGFRTRILQFTTDLSEYLGQCIGGVSHGNTSSASLFFNPVLKDSDSPVQNIFSHASSATRPFYDSVTAALGDGTLSINGDSWANPDFNKMLRLDITTGGDISAGEYKMSQRPILGFVDNTYQDNWVSLPAINSSNNFFSMFFRNSFIEHGRTSGSNRCGAFTTPYDDTKFLAFIHHRLARVDVMTQEREGWNVTSTPSADFQEIGQVMVADNGDMWVSDAIQGLFHITADGLTVNLYDNTHTDLTTLASSRCFGVTKTPGRIWLIMDNSLVYTTDNGVSFTIHTTLSIVSAGEEERYWFIQGDPNHADHRLAIVYNNYTYSSRYAIFRCRVAWWDTVSGHISTTPDLCHHSTSGTTAGSGDPQRRRELFNFFHCSPDDGVWGSRQLYDANPADRDASGMWDFGNTAPTHIWSSDNTESNRGMYAFFWSKDISNNDAMIMSTYWGSRARFMLCKQGGGRNHSDIITIDGQSPDGATSNYSTAAFQNSPKCILPSGIFMATNEFGSTSTFFGWWMYCVTDNVSADAGEFHNVIWKDYGWDGANWVEGNTNSKPMHASQDTLVDGLTVSWDDDSGAQSFTAGDYYTTGIVDGVLVDGGVEFDHRYALYYKKVLFDETDVDLSGIMPASTSVAKFGLTELERTLIVDGNNITYTDPSNYFYGVSTGPWSGRMHGPLGTGYIRTRFYHFSLGNNEHMTFGLANTSKIGATPTSTDIDYAVRLTNTGNNNLKVDIYNNNTIVHTLFTPSGEGNAEAEFNNNNYWAMRYDFIREEGSNDLDVYIRNQKVWTFVGVTSDLIPSMRCTTGSRMYLDSMVKSYSDYHISIGNSGSLTGVFHPNFFAIDYTDPGKPLPSQIKIDGVPVTLVLTNDYGRTTLNAGEIDILTHQGKVRFSASDVGKTLTFDRYNVLLHES